MSSTSAPPTDLEAGEHVVKYLEPYGYLAAGRESWRVQPGGTQGPSIHLHMDGHTEAGVHTFYHIRCSLRADPCPKRALWASRYQLGQLRTDLHDVVKALLGKRYSQTFSDAPFAHRGGIAGTTSRLHTWLARLARCINEGEAPPVLVAQ